MCTCVCGGMERGWGRGGGICMLQYLFLEDLAGHRAPTCCLNT